MLQGQVGINQNFSTSCDFLRLVDAESNSAAWIRVSCFGEDGCQWGFETTAETQKPPL
jgi:hypothetical protein